MKRKRNDAPWRHAVLARRGAYCRACGATRLDWLEIDHIIPRSQGGRSDVENGLVLCGPWGCDAHGRRHAREIVIRWIWLEDDQVKYLANEGWAQLVDGESIGRGRRNFERSNNG